MPNKNSAFYEYRKSTNDHLLDLAHSDVYSLALVGRSKYHTRPITTQGICESLLSSGSSDKNENSGSIGDSS